MITKDQLVCALPSKIRNKVSDEVINDINNLVVLFFFVIAN